MMPGMGGKMSPRQMNQMMRRLGIQVKEIPDVQEVVIKTSTKRYTFHNAEVTLMDAHGQKTYQLTGSATVRDLTPAEQIELKAATAVAPTGEDAEMEADPSEDTRSAAEQLADVAIEISDDDIAMVASQTGKSPKEAKAALEAAKGDLAEAIVQLSS